MALQTFGAHQLDEDTGRCYACGKHLLDISSAAGGKNDCSRPRALPAELPKPVRVEMVVPAREELVEQIADWFAEEFFRKCRLPAHEKKAATAKARAAAVRQPVRALALLRELSEKRRSRRK